MRSIFSLPFRFSSPNHYIIRLVYRIILLQISIFSKSILRFHSISPSFDYAQDVYKRQNVRSNPINRQTSIPCFYSGVYFYHYQSCTSGKLHLIRKLIYTFFHRLFCRFPGFCLLQKLSLIHIFLSSLTINLNFSYP